MGRRRWITPTRVGGRRGAGRIDWYFCCSFLLFLLHNYLYHYALHPSTYWSTIFLRIFYLQEFCGHCSDLNFMHSVLHQSLLLLQSPSRTAVVGLRVSHGRHAPSPHCPRSYHASPLSLQPHMSCSALLHLIPSNLALHLNLTQLRLPPYQQAHQ